ncbi:MAG: cytochrome c1 [Rhodospirillales bacterium]|nr:cytochrome c1 [Rhodospirillales bacterium]
MRPFILASLLAGGLVASAVVLPRSAQAQETALPHVNWSFEGPFGTYDRAAAQRGYQVYKEVCSACHSMQYVHFRDLAGIGLSPAQIKALAASVDVPTIKADGSAGTRPGLPSDAFPSPFPNPEAAAAANNGAIPPDQSQLLDARAGGADYIYAILTGYVKPPVGMHIAPGLYYNKYFPGHLIHMPQPLQADQVTYADGTKATIDQEAKDVTTFLAFVSNPEMEARKRMGVHIVLFLALLVGVTYAAKRKVWADVEH